MNRLFTAQHPVVVALDRQLAEFTKLVPSRRRVAVTPEQIATFMETTFWASLRTNEGRAVRFSATISSAASLQGSTVFAESVPYDEEHISKLALAQPPGGCLGVSSSPGPFEIWGFGRRQPWPRLLTVSVDISEPGVLRVSVGPYHPYAVLDGRSDPFLAKTENALTITLQTAIRTAVAKSQAELQTWVRECRMLGALARGILSDGHGGAVLVVPEETGDWTKSVSFAYRLERADTTIHDLIRQDIQEETIADLANIVRPYATMASVDGAVVVTKDMRVLGFGAKITAESHSGTVSIHRPITGTPDNPVPIAESGGTRHQSALRFVLAHHEAVALVVSQDRHLSIVYWSPVFSSLTMLRNAEWFA